MESRETTSERERFALPPLGWAMVIVALVCCSAFALAVGGKGVLYLVSTFGREQNAHEKMAAMKHLRIRMLTVRNAIEFYIFDTKTAPLDLAWLITAPEGMAGWDGPYIRRARIPSDPWDRAFRYEIVENGFRLSSAGPDGAFDEAEWDALSLEERAARLERLNIQTPPQDHDPTLDNKSVLHYHDNMASLVPPGTIRAEGVTSATPEGR